MAKKFVITLVNRKGGVSKTTSTAYMAMCLHQAGKKVIGVDADADKSLVKWSEAVSFPFPVVHVAKDNLVDMVEGLEGYIVIDTPPNDGEIIYAAAGIADEVIVPISGTGLDVNRLATTLSAIAHVEKMRQKPLASILLTRWRDNVTIGKEVLEMLVEKDLPVIDQRIRLLTRYEGFILPQYLEEYEAVLKELEVI